MGALFLVLVFVSVLLSCGTAHAEKRIALVIGNSAYKSVPRLNNPSNDATLVGGMFKRAGFELVDIRHDLSGAEMRKALRDFGGKAREAEVAIVYYAGHGIELDGSNYLIPTDAALETDTDVLDEAFPLDRVLFAIEPAKQLRLVILDACRDNPFAKTMKRTVAARAIGRGLAKVEPTSPNTMIAFAAKAGSTASDGDSRNSPFAKALVERLPTPGLDLRRAFGFVRDDVLKTTGYKQEPYVYGSLGGDDVPLVAATPVAGAAQANPQDALRRDYELALQAGNREAWEAFLQAYPQGFYAGLARAQLKNIAAEEARAAAAEKARQAEEARMRLAGERANKAEQEKLAAAARATEDAGVAAEKAKHVEDGRAAAAEQRRKDAEAAGAKTLADTLAGNKAVAEQKVAAIAPSSPPPSLSPEETSKLVQSELRRVGCLTASTDGGWNAASQRSLTLFNKYAGTNLDTKLASFDALDAVKGKPGRVCPLECAHGFRADGERCVKVTCRAGYVVGADNTCEKTDVTRRRQEEAKEGRQSPNPVASNAASPSSTASAISRLNSEPTCTNSRIACEQSRSKFGLSTASCAPAFTRCLQTGNWKGAYEGLARR